MAKLKEIAFEFKTLWNYLTRKELCEYYSVTDRTLYNYQHKLNLPKHNVIDAKVSNPQPVTIWIHENHKYKKKTFENWDRFAIWQKAQSQSIKIDTMQRDGKSYVTCDFIGKKPEAIEYEQGLVL